MPNMLVPKYVPNVFAEQTLRSGSKNLAVCMTVFILRWKYEITHLVSRRATVLLEQKSICHNKKLTVSLAVLTSLSLSQLLQDLGLIFPVFPLLSVSIKYT